MVVVYLFMQHPIITGLVCGCIWYSASQDLKRSRQQQAAVIASRGDERLCEFARSFNSRDVDTWIIRAVFEELQKELGGARVFPLRASDRFIEDLCIDLEDLDMVLVPAIAARTSRSLDDCRSNPYWGEVKTVAELVYAFNAQAVLNFDSY
ncbi:hypothetical protein ABT364_07425 [Massilia sp. SR12]